MSLFSFLFNLFTPPTPPSPHPRRRARTTCERCGKDVAIIASSGKLWDHACAQPTPSTEASYDDRPAADRQ